MTCGHWLRTVPERKVWLVEQDICPPCGRTLHPVTDWVIPYGRCPCCGARWVIEDGEVREVIFKDE